MNLDSLYKDELREYIYIYIYIYVCVCARARTQNLTCQFADK